MAKRTQTVSIEEFIAAFKEYEKVIREVLNISIVDFENQQTETIKRQLQIIRLHRNYIQHEQDSTFLLITETQLEVLQRVVAEIRRSQGIVKDYMQTLRRYGVLYSSNSLREVSAMFAKTGRDQLPVIEESTGNFLGMFSAYTLIQMVAEGISMTARLIPSGRSKAKPVPLKQVPTISADLAMCELPDVRSDVFVVVRGKKVIGVLEP